jgi:hypothetical protein
VLIIEPLLRNEINKKPPQNPLNDYEEKHSYRHDFHIMRSEYTYQALIARKTALECRKEFTHDIVRNLMQLVS